ncbi:Uncharacterised protein [Yersinia enterocolitica]|nr:hypothetical protein CH47_2203 [Yersinia enterocolitica]VTP72237.1 Uncharacterised protein [Yersinia enterocolitica subsp. enterocolitica]KGA74400.1 hypothetical protein DJ59_3001 [Yersinia enterocolitica]CFQ16546.1 Uncharacterised protein [Yersinia enterocolitica]CNF21635.1 Uncharacterised protein [Yersinia enterocolitica]
MGFFSYSNDTNDKSRPYCCNVFKGKMYLKGKLVINNRSTVHQVIACR